MWLHLLRSTSVVVSIGTSVLSATLLTLFKCGFLLTCIERTDSNQADFATCLFSSGILVKPWNLSCNTSSSFDLQFESERPFFESLRSTIDWAIESTLLNTISPRIWRDQENRESGYCYRFMVRILNDNSSTGCQCAMTRDSKNRTFP